MPEGFIKLEKKSGSMGIEQDSGPEYPWGLSIHLEDELIEELGLEALNAGDLIDIQAIGFVEHKSENQDQEKTTRSLRIQFTAIKAARHENSDHAETLYGSSS